VSPSYFVLEPEAVETSARRAGAWLRARGLVLGDRVAVVASNHPGFVPLTLGALRTGIIPVPVNVHLGAEERDRIVADADVGLALDDASWPALALDERGPELDLAPHPVARPMHYTSGTTGLAKGVWSGLLSEDDAASLAADEQELWDPHPGDTYLVCSPLYHSAPHRITISALAAGARMIVFEEFDADEIARVFVDERVAGAFLVPTHLRRLFARGFGAPYAHRILHAGEPCPEQLKRQAIDALPSGVLFEFYGSTEGQFTLCSSDEWLQRPRTVGRARSGRRLHTTDGVVYVEAPAFARWEYWRDPSKTAEAWLGNAFTVGDLGRIDEDGYLFLEGRREDLIISGGVNVYPAEVERILLLHPGVVEAAVFGEADPGFGQRVCAAVVGDADPEAVRLWARERLPGSHAPKRVVAVESLPRTATGKVRRSDLTA
jgi:acyl-CoA synthetase (AMP-forming)/AMP-acid ligase II